MIIVQLTGGLGNQLFQYAIGRALSERSKDTLMLDINSYSWDTLRKYELGVFNKRVLFAKKEQIERIKQSKPLCKDRFLNKFKRTPFPYFQLPYLKEQSFTFDTNYLNFRANNVYLEGYWQSENYFKHIRSKLLAEIQIDATMCSMSMGAYITWIKSTKNSVAIHVRRGDYLSNTETTAFHGLCGLEYYKSAMHHMEKFISTPTYFVFSDDKAYVKEIFRDQTNVVIIENIPFDYEELILMSLCQHNIIANSSFSWWGAWLNQYGEKRVIAPNLWFANNAMNSETLDLIPSSWTRI